jgi:hypothetical protein
MSPIIDLPQQISRRLREVMERRIAGFLKIDEKQFVDLAASLSLAELLNGIFLTEGQSETIGSYFGAIRFVGDLVGRDELFRRPEPAATEPEKESEAEQKVVLN